MEWFLNELTFWHWLILGVLLILLELAAPGVVFLWVGLAALVVGLIKLVFAGMGWEVQVLIFAVLSVAVTIFGRNWAKSKMTETDHPNLNQRGQQYVGRTFTLSQAIDNGTGKITVDDSTWKVAGDDMPQGTKVEVTGVRGVILEIKKVEAEIST